MEIVNSLFQGDVYEASKKMLDVAAMKHSAVASNIANSSTPGYKRVDISKTFEQELQQSIKSRQGASIASLQPSIEQDSTAISTRMDGNNVQLDQELLALSGNSTNYQALSQFVSGSLRQIRTAITGRSA